MATGFLLLHAFPLDSSMWEPQVKGLKDVAPVVAPDLPGLGTAAPASNGNWMDGAADAAASAMKAAGLDQAVVVGLSMGGYVAFSFLRKYPELVSGLVLANTRAGADDDAGKQRRRDLATKLRAEGSQFLVDAPPPLLSATPPAGLLDQVKGIINKQSAEGIAAASEGMGDRVDSTPDLEAASVPVLVITSSGDTLIPAAASTPMAEQSKDGSLVVIEGAGHLSNLEAPEEFNQALKDFYAKVAK